MGKIDMEKSRPFRSVLYMPGSNMRALAKIPTVKADAFILDLEDATAPEQKETARANVAALLANYHEHPQENAPFLMVRVNGLDTPWGAEDFSVLAPLKPSAFLIPKVNTAQDVNKAVGVISAAGNVSVPLWLMIETPLGVLNAPHIMAASPRIQGVVMGTNDLTKELQAQFTEDRLPLLMSLQHCLLAARAVGVHIVDGVYNNFKDGDGLRRECLQGLQMGFEGKTLIHPEQLDICHDVFTPSPAEIEQAQQVVSVFEAALKEGRGVAVLEGRIVENLHVEAAKRVLAQAGFRRAS